MRTFLLPALGKSLFQIFGMLCIENEPDIFMIEKINHSDDPRKASSQGTPADSRQGDHSQIIKEEIQNLVTGSVMDKASQV